MIINSLPLFDFNKAVDERKVYPASNIPSKTENVSQGILKNIGELPEIKPIVQIANYSALPSDVGMCARSVWNVNGSSYVGFTTLMYVLVGTGWAYDAFNESDMVKVAENLSLVVGSVIMAGFRAATSAEEVRTVQNQPIPAAVTSAIFWLGLFSGIFFVIYSGFLTYRFSNELIDFLKGGELRTQLLNAQDPKQELNGLKKDELEKRILNELPLLSLEKLETMAIDHVSQWLGDLAKKMGEPVFWNESENTRRIYAKELLMNHPEYLMKEIGSASPFLSDTYEDNTIARFGASLMAKRLSDKVDAFFAGRLGTKAVEAAKNGKVEELQKLLGSWNTGLQLTKITGKILVGLISAAASAVSIASSLGTAPAVAFAANVLYILSGIGWLAATDFEEFKKQWNSTEVGEWDQLIIVTNTILSVSALIGLIGLTVALHGAPIFAVGIGLTAFWLLTNIYGEAALQRALWRRENTPWDCFKAPTAEMFRKLIETNPTSDKINEVLAKMTPHDQENLVKLYEKHTDWKTVADMWEKTVKKESDKAVTDLLHHLEMIKLELDARLEESDKEFLRRLWKNIETA